MSLHQATGLARGRSEPGPKKAARVLGVVSGKGGVGKSTIAVNLATAAAIMGARTLLVDGDIGLANADLLMGLVPKYDLGDWCSGRVALSEVSCQARGGVEVMVAGGGVEVEAQIRDAVLGRSAGGLGTLMAERDLTVLDLGAGIARNVLDLACACEVVWLVATPEPTSLADAYATAKLLWERKPFLQIELVVNRSPDRAASERAYQALGRLTQRFLSRSLTLRAALPEDPAMIRSVSVQTPLVLAEPHSPAARRLRLLAESLLEEGSSSASSFRIHAN